MKLAATIVTVGIMACGIVQAGPATGRTVTVYSIAHGAVPYQVEAAAKDQASRMFGDIGVRFLWLYGNPTHPDASSIAIEIVSGTPATFMPGSLAYAYPYEGIHIRIFWDRIKDYGSPREVLAHVMVHEITHILQGVARHSDEGIMKAHWGPGDLSAMARKPLSFTPEDLDLIYAGLDNREARTMTAALATPANHARESR